MIDRVLLDSRHKFVYFEEDVRDNFSKAYLNYPAVINSEEPIAVYVKDAGLSDVSRVTGLDGYRVRAFHNSYYEALISLSVIDTLINQIDKDILNVKLQKVYDYASLCGGGTVKNIDDLRIFLYLIKEEYRSLYENYLRTRNCNFKKNSMLVTIVIDIFLPKLKEALGLKKHFALLYDYNGELSVINIMAINCYIASRCNKYLSINILCGSHEWKCYYDMVGNIIENIHDYTEIYDGNVKKKIRHI